jgi:hypothetical protein
VFHPVEDLAHPDLGGVIAEDFLPAMLGQLAGEGRVFLESLDLGREFFRVFFVEK